MTQFIVEVGIYTSYYVIGLFMGVGLAFMFNSRNK